MAIRAVNLHQTKSVSHPDDKEDPTVFEIGAVDSRVMGHLRDKSTKVSFTQSDAETNPDAEAGVQVNNHELNFRTVQFGLKGFVNFKDDNGDIALKTESVTVGSRRYDVMHGDIVSLLPDYVIEWLAAQIGNLNAVGYREGKN